MLWVAARKETEVTTKLTRPNRTRFIFAVTLAMFVALSLSVGQGVARASTTINVSWTIHGPYSCVGPCATATQFMGNGIAHSPLKVLGTMTYSFVGAVLDYNPVTNCLDQSENWAFTLQNGHEGKDTFDLSTTSDTFCFTDDPNVSIETATYDITGGTGRFSGATGAAFSELTILTHPQKGSGTFTATITY